jgi:citrate synthase
LSKKGVVYEALGIPAEFFTTNFAMSRSVGWLALFMESRANNKIIRPAVLYVGSAVQEEIA